MSAINPINNYFGYNERPIVGASYNRNLYDYIDETCLTSTKKHDLALLMVRAVKAFHERGEVHGDIRLENFLYDESRVFLNEIDDENCLRGVLACFSFEMIEQVNHPNASYENDLWALGISLYILYENSEPAWCALLDECHKTPSLFGQVKLEMQLFQDEIGESLTRKLLSINPEDRPTLDTLEASLMIHRLYTKDYNDRILEKVTFQAAKIWQQEPPQGKTFTAYKIDDITYQHYRDRKVEILLEKFHSRDKDIHLVISFPKGRRYIQRKSPYNNYFIRELSVIKEIGPVNWATHPFKGGFFKDGKAVFNYPFYRDGDLFQFLYKKIAPPFFKHCVAYDLVLALDQLHQKKIIHCDLKLANVLLDIENSQTVLTDFEHACRESEVDRLSRIFGTHPYLAPEIIDGFLGHQVNITSYQRDIWALGICLFIFYRQVFPSWYTPLKEGDFLRARDEIEKFQSQIGDDPLLKLLSVNPADRPDLKTIMQVIDQYRTDQVLSF